MSRILLLLENRRNRVLLANWLSTHYEVIRDEADVALAQPFDLCLLDGPTLDRIWQQVQERKNEEQPLFLPFVLITSRRDVDLVTRHLWKTTDELISLPIEKTELHARVEVLLRARRLSLELKMRNEDLQSFIHAMTHDLRAPLRAINGYIEAICEDDIAALSKSSQHYLQMMQQVSQQMQDLVEALLNFSRIGREEVQLQPVILQLVFEDSLHQLEYEINKKDAHIEYQNGAVIQANPVLLRMVLVNLLSNALKFVASGVQPSIVISASIVEDRCRIEIRDNGIGIASQNQPDLFTPFVQLYGVEEYPGVGLGLATVRKAVELMGGHVGVTSSPGEGSTFWFELSAVIEVEHALSGS